MLARPLASETVSARAVCRLKCSVVANVAAGPRRGPRLSASGALLASPPSSDPGAVRRVPPPRLTASRADASELVIAYLKGWRNASPAFGIGQPRDRRELVAVRLDGEALATIGRLLRHGDQSPAGAQHSGGPAQPLAANGVEHEVEASHHVL